MRILRETPFWKSQQFALCALACLILAVKGPLLQNPSFTARWFSLHVRNGFSLLAAPEPYLRWSAWLLLTLGILALWLISNLQTGAAKIVSFVLIAVSAAITIAGIKNIDVYNDLTATSLVPAYIPIGQSVALGWAWVFILLAPLLFWIAVSSAPQVSQNERKRILDQSLILHWEPSQEKPAPALLADVGTCDKCDAKNSLRATKCHACGAVLPWETARLQKSDKANRVAAARNVRAASTTGDVLVTGFLWLVVFCLCAMMPLIGYFAWRVLDNGESKYSGASFCGWIFGAVVIVGGFLVRFLLTMSRVGAMH